MTENTEDQPGSNHILQSELQSDKELIENGISEPNINENNDNIEIKSDTSSENHTENDLPLSDRSHSIDIQNNTDSQTHLHENDFTASDRSQSTEIKSEITSTPSYISEEESDDVQDNISLTLSIFQEENERLKSNIENLELIVSQQQKKINDNEVKLHDLEQKNIQNEKIKYDLEHRLHLVFI